MQKQEQVYLGVDWSASEIVVATATDEVDPRKIRAAKRSFEGVCELDERIRRRHPDCGEIHAFIESGDMGWVLLLHGAGMIVHIVDGKQAQRFAQSFSSSGAKDDKRDALYMAQMGKERCARLCVWSPPDRLAAQLQELSSIHSLAKKKSTAEQQRIRAVLREEFPEFEALLSNLTTSWCRKLLHEVPTRHHAKSLSKETFDHIMRRVKPATREAIWNVFQGDLLPTDDAFAEIRAIRVRALLDELDLHIEQCAVFEKKIDELTQGHKFRESVESFLGFSLGIYTRVVVLAFDTPPSDRDEVSRKLGASPVFYGSGKDRSGQPKGIVKMRHSVSSMSKQTSYLMGLLATRYIPWAKARRAHDAKHGKSAAQSFRAIARSLCRILTAMYRDGTKYDDAFYVRRLKQEGVVWAMDL